MTAKQKQMLTLAESCQTFEELTMLLVSTVERMFAEDTDVPAALGVYLDSLALRR